MKVNLLKQIIKEALKEALSEVLTEQAKAKPASPVDLASTTFANSKEFSNPLQSLIEQTRREIKPNEASSLLGADTQISMESLHSPISTDDSQQSDILHKASAIFKAMKK